jgi:hypothetical protein
MFILVPNLIDISQNQMYTLLEIKYEKISYIEFHKTKIVLTTKIRYGNQVPYFLHDP